MEYLYIYFIIYIIFNLYYKLFIVLLVAVVFCFLFGFSDYLQLANSPFLLLDPFLLDAVVFVALAVSFPHHLENFSHCQTSFTHQRTSFYTSNITCLIWMFLIITFSQIKCYIFTLYFKYLYCSLSTVIPE